METGSNLFITFPAFFRKWIIHFSNPDLSDMPVIKHLAPVISEYIIHSIIFFLHWRSYYCICLPMFRDFFKCAELHKKSQPQQLQLPTPGTEFVTHLISLLYFCKHSDLFLAITENWIWCHSVGCTSFPRWIISVPGFSGWGGDRILLFNWACRFLFLPSMFFSVSSCRAEIAVMLLDCNLCQPPN